jgi:hypothetical protein
MASSRAPRPVMRKAKRVAVQAAVPMRVAGLVDGFLELLPAEEKKRPVREKVVRRLRQLHPMD